jgi:hypothetical protein
LYASRGDAPVALPWATQLPGFRGTQDMVFTLIEGLTSAQPLYAHVDVSGTNAEPISFSSSTLDRTLARGAEHARIIALTFRLTCSIGVASSDTLGVWGEHLIAKADAAVYVAKRLGRNQVQMAAPLVA